MTLLEVEELTRYWSDHPPLHLLLAALLGKQRASPAGSPKMRAAPGRTPDKRAEQLLADLGSAFIAGDVHAGLGTVLLDAAELRRKTAAADRALRTGHEIAAR